MFLASKTVWLCRKYFYASETVKAQHLWGEKERERPEIEESPRWPESPSPWPRPPAGMLPTLRGRELPVHVGASMRAFQRLTMRISP